MNCRAEFVLFGLVLCAYFSILDGTLSKSSADKGKKKVHKEKPKKNGEFKKLTSSDASLTYSEILQNHERVDYREEKKFPGDVLGYVTPWNNHGYDVVKYLAQKFSHISPVWFQILPSTENNDPATTRCFIKGTHDLDQGWIQDIKKNNSDVKIVPRFFFEGWNARYNIIESILQIYDRFERHLFAYEEEQNKCAQIVVNFIQRNNFDGGVLELWVHVMSMSQGMAAGELIHFIINWAEIFSGNGLISILPVPTPLNGEYKESAMFTGHHFSQLVPYVDFINVMTYDFPDRRAGPVAPIDWVRKSLESLIVQYPEFKYKLLMGLNFYGYDYAPMGSKVEPVIGKKFLEILSKHKPEISWNSAAAEHFIEYKQHILYYPSLVSVEARLNLAKELGVGGTGYS